MDWSKFSNFKKEIAGKKVLILGLGLQGGGVGAVKFFHKLGSKIRVTDLKSESQLAPSLKKIQDIPLDKTTFGENKKDDVDFADVILLNPAVSRKSEIFEYIKQKNKKVLMEEALFTSLCPVQTIGVSGTRGKTTTTVLIGELLKQKYKVHLAGNIPGSETLMLLFNIQSENEKVVMELSSFELFGFHLSQISPNVSVLINISEDHLNVYKTMDDYVSDKKAIYQYQKQGDFLVINNDLLQSKIFSDIKTTAKATVTPFAKQDVLKFNTPLKGEHNLENLAAAYKVAKIFEVPEEKIVSVIRNFNGIPFREEKIREYKGITFINDTTASTPTATLKAIEKYKKGKIILLCGGNSKNCDFSRLASSVKENCKLAVFLKGNATASFRQALQNIGMPSANLSEIFDNLEKAVHFAVSHAEKGDIILLSPAFTSFGEFNNEFERGEKFNKIVFSLK